MTTHLRARAAQAGALLAVVAVGIAVTPEVALAVSPTVQITDINTEVTAGAGVDVEYRVASGNGRGEEVEIVVTGMTCADNNCRRSAQVDGEGRTFTAHLTAPNVAAGSSQNVNVVITVANRGDAPGVAQQAVRVNGPDKPQTVTQISGKVKDQNGKAVAGAQVAIKDSAGAAYSATTNGSGGYSFISSDGNPIAAGTITVAALKSGYDSAKVDIQAAAGRSVNVPLTLKLQAVAATATPSETPSAEASDEATDEATDAATDEATTAATTPAADSSGLSSKLFLLFGGLLVVAGIGAIVLVMMRRRNADRDDALGGDDPTAFGAGPGVVPPSQGFYNDATRVGAPMGAGPDATMVTPRVGAGSLADAPTMLHRPGPVDDEFPDPYGAPAPRQGGYRGGSYGEPTRYGRQDDDGYGAGNYAPARSGGYDEPTGLYRPEADQDDNYGGYDRGGSGYGGSQYGGGVGAYQSGGYQGGGYQGGGYDRGGYDDGSDGYVPRSGGGNYGGASSGGNYGAQRDSGYDEGGYDDQRGGYGRGSGAGAYDDGYDDQRGGYGGRARQESRRSSDWEN